MNLEDHQINKDKAQNVPYGKEASEKINPDPSRSFGGATNEGTSAHLGKSGEQVYKDTK